MTSLHHNYAFDYVNTIIAMSSGNDINIFIEDARKRKWYGKDSGSKQQGAGAIKAICSFWEEWSKTVCDNTKIHVNFIHPLKGGTKLDAKKFKQMTGWVGRTNEHMRDAGAIAFTYNPKLSTV